jgi:hypothetical protein
MPIIPALRRLRQEGGEFQGGFPWRNPISKKKKVRKK